jgi:DNA-binding MarR family transcriptional regulator
MSSLTGPAASLPAPAAQGEVDERLPALASAVARLRRSLRRAIRPEYPWETLPMAQVEVLQLLEEAPDIAISEVAARLRLASNTVSTLVGALLREDLVARRSDDRDRRIGRLALTERGAERLGGWRGANEQLLVEAVESLPADLRAELLGAVAAIDALSIALNGGPAD